MPSRTTGEEKGPENNAPDQEALDFWRHLLAESRPNAAQGEAEAQKREMLWRLIRESYQKEFEQLHLNLYIAGPETKKQTHVGQEMVFGSELAKELAEKIVARTRTTAGSASTASDRKLRSDVAKAIDETSQLKRQVFEWAGDFEDRLNARNVNTDQWLSLLSAGINPDEVRLTRYIPVRLYLSEGLPPGLLIDDGIYEFLEVFGFEVSSKGPTITGSLFQKLFAKSKDTLTRPEVIARLEKIERAVEVQKLGLPQAEVDLKEATAIATLLKAIEHNPYVAMQVGSILMVKTTADGKPLLQVKTLSQMELIYLENNQDLLTSPATILEKLARIAREGNGEIPTQIEGQVTGDSKPSKRIAEPERPEHRPGL